MWNLTLTTHKKKIIEINPNMIKIIPPYKFPMGSWSWLDDSTLHIESK